MPVLTTTVRRDLDADVTTVRARGRLDQESISALAEVLLGCATECPTAIVVDVSDCDATTDGVLAVFPAVTGTLGGLPSVVVVLCGADNAYRSRGRRAALGGVPAYETCGEARSAVQRIRAAQERIVLHLPRSTSSPRWARDALSTACAAWDVRHLRTPALLIITELVTNALVHAHSDVSMEAALRGDYLHLRVRDQSPDPPRVIGSLIDIDVSADHGRGLPIVAYHSTAWGFVIQPDLEGKVVWATLRADPSAKRD